LATGGQGATLYSLGELYESASLMMDIANDISTTYSSFNIDPFLLEALSKAHTDYVNCIGLENGPYVESQSSDENGLLPGGYSTDLKIYNISAEEKTYDIQLVNEGVLEERTETFSPGGSKEVSFDFDQKDSVIYIVDGVEIVGKVYPFKSEDQGSEEGAFINLDQSYSLDSDADLRLEVDEKIDILYFFLQSDYDSQFTIDSPDGLPMASQGYSGGEHLTIFNPEQGVWKIEITSTNEYTFEASKRGMQVISPVDDVAVDSQFNLELIVSNPSSESKTFSVDLSLPSGVSSVSSLTKSVEIAGGNSAKLTWQLTTCETGINVVSALLREGDTILCSIDHNIFVSEGTGDGAYTDPTLEMTLLENNLSFTRVSFDLKNEGDVASTTPWGNSGGIHIRLIDAVFSDIDLGEYGEVVAFDEEGNRLDTYIGSRIIEIYCKEEISIGEHIDTGSIRIDKVGDDPLVLYRCWTYDEDDKVSIAGTEDYYTGRCPADVNYGKHNLDDIFTYLDYACQREDIAGTSRMVSYDFYDLGYSDFTVYKDDPKTIYVNCPYD
ncbi:MAG TPA: hypothetical protein PK718_07695, partial [Candidatus Methanofastidiosa archaeon]|nr:hypothetical protein [Candidatus Methanofastidiosa archaeon]